MVGREFPEQRGLQYCPACSLFCDRDENSALCMRDVLKWELAYAPGGAERPFYLSKNLDKAAKLQPFYLREPVVRSAAATTASSLPAPPPPAASVVHANAAAPPPPALSEFVRRPGSASPVFD
jgi:hypothetical protein